MAWTGARYAEMRRSQVAAAKQQPADTANRRLAGQARADWR